MAIKLELEIKEAELAIAGLYKLPMEVAEPIVHKIKAQAIPQIAEQQAEVQNAVNKVESNPETQVKVDEAEANSDSTTNE
jgi:hypothetical protein